MVLLYVILAFRSLEPAGVAVTLKESLAFVMDQRKVIKTIKRGE